MEAVLLANLTLITEQTYRDLFDKILQSVLTVLMDPSPAIRAKV